MLSRARQAEAFEEEAQAPGPLRRVHAQAEEQRRVLAGEPAQDLQGRARAGPRLGVADGDLAAVGEGGLQAGTLAALDDLDLVARLRQVPGGRGADDARAQHDDFHVRFWSPETDKGRGAIVAALLPLPASPPGVGAEYREMP